MSASPASAPKTVRLVQYLEHLAKIRSATILDISAYEKVLWLGRLPEEAECYSCHRSEQHEDPDLWVEIRKPKEPTLPSPPEACGRWVERESLHQHELEPKLFKTLSPLVTDSSPDDADLESEPGRPTGEGLLLAELASTEPKPLRLEDHPQVTRAWDEYLDTKWRPWAAERKRWQSVQDKYAKLFEMHSALQSKGEQLELLIGVGCLCWKHDGQRVCRHVLAGRVSLVFDEKRGHFQIRPGDGGLELAAEFDMLPNHAIPRGLESETRERLKAIGEDLWERTAVDGVLSSIVHSLAHGGAYDPTRNDLCEQFTDRPQIAFAPAIILRKRSQRGVEQFLRKIKDLLEGGAEPPQGWGDLSEQTGSRGGKSGSGDHSDRHKPAASEPESEYLPLPVNDEQKQILKALRHPIGALVQGPPGTGKSHTIANLICHLLATGKRVLITAQTPRALQVLREKLPEAIRPLAVSLLGTGTDDQLSLEQSVRGITERLDDPKARQYREMASEHSKKRRQAAGRVADLLNRHRSLREKDTLKQHVAGYAGTAEQIARALHEESDNYAWFTDMLRHDCADHVDEAELMTALAALRRFDAESRSRLQMRRPRIDGPVPEPAQFRLLVELELSAESVLERRFEKQAPPTGVSPDSLRLVRAAFEGLRRLEVSIQNASKRPQSWIAAALTDVLTEQDRPWFQLQSETEKALSEIRERAATEDRRTVAVPSASDWPTLRHDAETLRAYLEAGGKPRLWLFKPKPIKSCRYLTRDVRIDGRLCDNTDSLGLLASHAHIQLAVAHMWRLWDGRANPKSRSLAMQVQEAEELQEALGAVLAAYRDLEEAKSAISNLGDCFEPHWHEPESRKQVRDELEARAANIEFAGAQAKLREAADALRILLANPDSDRQSINSLLDAIDRRDAVAFESAAEQLGRLESDAAELAAARSCIEALRVVLPRLASFLDSQPENPHWDVRLPQLAAAMNHARARQWLDEFISSANLNEIEQQLDAAEREVSEQTTKEAALLAWAYVIDRMREEHRRALMAWQQAIKALGKGTGKYAFRHRREAQAQLQKCRDAIPAWIMPLHRVFDGIDPLPGMFDVVIVDEASQCGPDALPLFFIGKKVVIVGDDKQISPSHAGINHEHVHQYMQEFLGDFEHRATFDLHRSLFDHGELRVGNRIVLREHFRCMPEIIRFSNDLSYQATPLVPLRQYPPKRLAPLVARHVSAGLREGQGSSVINRPEAEMLVDAIVQCCKDPAYVGKNGKLTMGVISLQAWKQAEYIEQLLLRRLGAEEMASRRLLCGDAYSFQGDERDVIFLSMVAAPNAPIGALTKNADQQRFNVAASRARDQLWLFHTATPADLSDQCMRRRLLDHFLDPTRTTRHIAGIEIDDLQSAAHRAKRSVDKPPEPFESWFEVDVALCIGRKGYRIVAQHEVGGYRIDLVVEGAQSRLAVECDGDYWHGADRYNDDLKRQRRLERAKWTFARVRSCLFYANSDEALRPVWERLDALGIYPYQANEPPVEPTATDESAGTENGEVEASADPEVVEPESGDGGSEEVTEPVEPSSSTNDASTSMLKIESYSHWTPCAFEDPRHCSQQALIDALLAIVAAEGPIIASRAYGLYAKAAGIQRVGSSLRGIFNRAVMKAVRKGLIEMEETNPLSPVLSSVLRPAGAPAVRPRSSGGRTISEIPPSEVAWVLGRFMEDRPGIAPDDLYRLALEHYGFQRLRGPTRERLAEIHSTMPPLRREEPQAE